MPISRANRTGVGVGREGQDRECGDVDKEGGDVDRVGGAAEKDGREVQGVGVRLQGAGRWVGGAGEQTQVVRGWGRSRVSFAVESNST